MDTRMPLAWHLQTEWENSVSYEMGVQDGIRLAVTMIGDNILAALARPRGHGGPDLDVEARERVTDLYRRYLGVGVRPADR
jgi:hypothetical protein